MAVTEVKKEPIEYEDPTEFEETVLKKIIKPPQNKVSLLYCIELMLYNTIIPILYK